MKVESEIAGAIWSIEVEVGDDVEEDDALIMIESMKMEIPAAAPSAGKVVDIHVKEGDIVREGQLLVTLDPS
jgi:acetyl-CoA carboxylase biotin carboxyl carrier protein